MLGGQGNSTVPLETVVRIQRGQTTSAFSMAASHRRISSRMRSRSNATAAVGAEERSLSLVCQDGRTIDLVLPDLDTCAMWYIGFKALVQDAHTSHAEEDETSRYFRMQWNIADSNGDNSLSIKEIVKLVQSMNLNRDQRTITGIVQQVDSDRNNVLDFDEFKRLMAILADRPELPGIFGCIIDCGNGDLRKLLETVDGAPAADSSESDEIKSRMMPFSAFENFMRNLQREEVTEEVLERLAKLGCERGEPLSYTTFVHFLSSSGNTLFDPAANDVYMDMTQPLSHYYVASSHNTYLEGDQLRSKSSVHRYIDDLHRGCRCVELDCWDGDGGEPVIYHGHTLTSKILFRNVLEAIDTWAFKASEFPVILSIENHCSIPQQEKMAEYIKSIFGDKLALPLPVSLDGDARLPSPEELKGKILIKGKVNAAENTEEAENEDEDDFEQEGLTEAEAQTVREIEEQRREDQKKKVAEALEQCVYLRGQKFKGFEQSLANDNCTHMSSFSESKTEKLLKSKKEEWIAHNQRQMSRIYPAGRRVDSSNYDPVPSWAVGSQIVALNYQTPGAPMHCNTGLFRDNGNCGYVLKPPPLLPGGELSGGMRTSGVRQMLQLQILSAQHLPKPEGELKGEVIDPYVQIEVKGHSTDSFAGKTKTITDNGFNPVFGEVFRIPLAFPELAMIRFAVYDHDLANADDFIAQSAMRVQNIRTGLRRVNLFSDRGTREGRFEFASLLVKVGLQEVKS